MSKLLVGGRDPVLIHWSNLTFTNATTGDRYVWDPKKRRMYGPFATDVPGIANIGGKLRLQMEGERVNRITDLASWTYVAATRTGGQADPLGGSLASLIEGLDDSTFPAADTLGGGTNDAPAALGLFLKPRTTTGNMRWFQRAGSLEGDWNPIVLDTIRDWDRISDASSVVTVANTWEANGAGTHGLCLRGPASGVDILALWPQIEEAAFLSSPIPPAAGAVTRNADDASMAAGAIPAEFLNAAWYTEVTTEHASDDLATSDIHYIVYIDANNYLAIIEDGGGNVQLVWKTTSGTVVRTITYARDATFRVGLNFATGEMYVDGTLTGFGTVSGTVSDWPVGTTYFGHDSSVANPLFGLIAEPRFGVLESLQTIGGDFLALLYDAEHSTPGPVGEPVSLATNQGTHGSVGDIAQAVPSQRPPLTGGGTSALWEFADADDKYLTAESIAKFASTGDTLTVFCVAVPGPIGYMAAVQSTVGFGVALLGTTTQVTSRSFTVTGGFVDTVRTFTAAGGPQLFEGRIETGRTVAAVDGVETEALGSTGGVDGDQIHTSVGRSRGSTTFWDSDVLAAVTLVNATPAVCDAMRVFLQAKYGTPALP